MLACIRQCSVYMCSFVTESSLVLLTTRWASESKRGGVETRKRLKSGASWPSLSPRNTPSDTSSVLSSYFGSFFQTQPHPTGIPGNLFTVLFTLNIFVVFSEMVLDQKKPNKNYPRQRPLPTVMGGCGWLVGSPPSCLSFQSDHMINTRTMQLLPLSP